MKTDYQTFAGISKMESRHIQKMAASVVAILAAIVVSGCIQTSVVPLSGTAYPPLHEDEVTIYLRAEDVPGDYEKVAIIYAKGDYAATDEAQMFKAVRKKAAKLGANGVLLEEVTEPGTGAKVAQHILGTGANRRGELIAIYVAPIERRN